MMRCGHQVRLTQPELSRWSRITGFVPQGVKTMQDLDAFIAECKRYYWGTSYETKFLHWLIDEEKKRCLSKKLSDPHSLFAS